MTKARILEKKKTKSQNMGVKDGLVAKKKNQKVKGNLPVKKNVFNKKNKQNDKKANGPSKPASTGKRSKGAFNEHKFKVKDESESDDVDIDSENDNESMEDSDVQNDTVKSVERKGVNMFKGIKAEEGSDDEECEEDDDSEEEDSDDEGELDESTGLKALLGESIGDDDDDDDFNEDDESDDDDDDLSEDDEVVNKTKSKNIQEAVENSSDDNEDDDEDDDDDDDDEDDEDDEKDESVGLKALLGESLADDDDDMDFEEGEDDEDDDESLESDEDENDESIEKPKTPTKKESKAEAKTPPMTEEDRAKTIYVGNLPKTITQNEIKKLFRPCGEVATIRIRGVVPEDSRMTPKVATITKKVHPKVHSVYAYVLFKNKSSVTEALKLNGHKIGEHTIRVDLSKSKDHDGKKAVFIGNLAFDTTDDEVRSHFASCGKIESIRLIRDRKTGLGVGVGYVNFVDEDSVTLALELNETTLKKRQIRVQNYSSEKKSTKRNRGKFNKKNSPNEPRKKFKDGSGKAVTVKNEVGKTNKKKQKRSQGEVKREKSTESQSPSPVKASFQGQTSDKKKKSKNGKLNKKKKIMAEKLTSSKKAN